MTSKVYGFVGGNSGIGLAAIRHLLSKNHTVVAAARNPAPLLELGVDARPWDALNPSAIVWPAKLDGHIHTHKQTSTRTYTHTHTL